MILNPKHRQNIVSDKIFAVSKEYWRLQNILSPTKCWHNQNVGVDKILASTKCWHQQNTHIDKILAPTEILRWQKSRVYKMLAHAWKHLLTVWLCRVYSSWLLPDLADFLLLLPEGVDPTTCSRQVCHCHWPLCFYWRTLSRTVLAYCTCPPCRKGHKYWHRQNISAAKISLIFPKL